MPQHLSAVRCRCNDMRLLYEGEEDGDVTAHEVCLSDEELMRFDEQFSDFDVTITTNDEDDKLFPEDDRGKQAGSTDYLPQSTFDPSDSSRGQRSAAAGQGSDGGDRGQHTQGEGQNLDDVDEGKLKVAMWNIFTEMLLRVQLISLSVCQLECRCLVMSIYTAYFQFLC